MRYEAYSTCQPANESDDNLKNAKQPEEGAFIVAGKSQYAGQAFKSQSCTCNETVPKKIEEI